jgi:hypothetical protein
MATAGKLFAWALRGRVLGLLLLAPAVSGCEAMDRMDYFDRFFEPASRPGPVLAMDPVANPGDYAPSSPDAGPQPRFVRAMEPIANPGDYAPSAERAPQTASVRATEPRPSPAAPAEADPESRTRLLVRQNPWVTRFWMELTPTQQARVERQLYGRSNLRLAAGQTDSAAAWDLMGLADRVALVFGGAPPVERPAPAERRGGSTLAGSS